MHLESSNLVTLPKGTGPLTPVFRGGVTLPTPLWPHPVLTNRGDRGHRKEEGAHELPAPHAGGVAKDDVPTLVRLDNALGERLQ